MRPFVPDLLYPSLNSITPTEQFSIVAVNPGLVERNRRHKRFVVGAVVDYAVADSDDRRKTVTSTDRSPDPTRATMTWSQSSEYACSNGRGGNRSSPSSGMCLTL